MTLFNVLQSYNWKIWQEKSDGRSLFFKFFYFSRKGFQGGVIFGNCVGDNFEEQNKGLSSEKSLTNLIIFRQNFWRVILFPIVGGVEIGLIAYKGT